MTGGDGPEELVLVGTVDGVATVTLNRPERHNSLIPELLAHLRRAVHEVGQRNDIGVVVIAANGPSFSTGGDLGNFDRAENDLVEYATRLVGQLNDTIVTIAELDVPTIAVVDGQVTGGSIGIVLACDLVVVTDRASFSPWYADIGLSPDGGWTAMLPAAIGAKRATYVQLLNETIGADQAVDWGLAFRKTDRNNLDRDLSGICQRLLEKKAGSQSCAKRLLRQPALRRALERERRLFLEHIATPEAIAGVGEFLRRRA